MFFLQLRMWLLLTLLFGIVYALVVVAGTALGIGGFYFYLFFSFALMFFQFMIGPKIVEWSMRVQYVKREDYPQLFDMVESQARRANIPTPRVCVSSMPIPNAFAFGRGRNDGLGC